VFLAHGQGGGGSSRGQVYQALQALTNNNTNGGSNVVFVFSSQSLIGV
jgi:hypothetical protein